MTLSEKRCLFSQNVSKLVLWAGQRDYMLAYDQVKRTELEAVANAASGAGIANSLHNRGLAADLLLYINGVYQSNTLAHEPIGAYWKTLHPLNRWGGDFSKPDGNHYSMEDGGVQ